MGRAPQRRDAARHEIDLLRPRPDVHGGRIGGIGLSVGGIDARPREYERRVVGFFDNALR